MNILHLKYAVEVAKAGSLSKAAEALYMNQPNLSRAIKDLEGSLGITIFGRSAKGVYVTPEGEEFLGYARKILQQIDEVEAIYKTGAPVRQRFSISVPRAGYISAAFANFSRHLGPERAEIFYKETNAMRVIRNILTADYKLGILRYASNYERYFKEMLDEKGLTGELVGEFHYVLLMSREHRLAKKETITFQDLRPYIEIAHADPYVPSLPLSTVKKEELPEDMDRRIFVFERASQYDLLQQNPETFMWVSPAPDETLARYNLVQRACLENQRLYRDMLIYRKDYKLTELDRDFIAELYKARSRYLEQ